MYTGVDILKGANTLYTDRKCGQNAYRGIPFECLMGVVHP